MNQQQYENARLAGHRARQASKKRDDSPKYAMGEEGALLREAWREGWDEADAERRKAA
ncbi:DNA-directed RNA polymerase subunit K/omega [Xanthomonas arboricola]|jgi:DNA-directed RNA polymerase subunit K/omega|uniref:hypothetical protein n=1 Tax=Xanthomonas TaxID=338 RepID=UPI000A92BA2F|nr:MULTISPECIES: hypothetical protein [Xanthomonas]MBB5675538.1 DNA-directed RNA polymerase subunit K/omega [Xanthomonas arboricola]MBB5737202.1 DNA-directed RNA polymerase subunit K/omega [Xanthomonas sp. CFBP 8152]MBB5862614.1 DNA-directed RNA polymerase subunit K/omega [Xanthomonas sp. 3058]MBB6573505.1 DNA-directed RNA polymerase subunit K/omega [Xanthomonas arboricola]NJC36401.1 DNA-directed RNA polymerase subunit K/omega [Xanthomonas euroxanthea]